MVEYRLVKGRKSNLLICFIKKVYDVIKSGNKPKLKADFQSVLRDSGFVFVFVLNSLKRYTSVTAYIKFFSPPLQFVSFTNFRWAETSVSNSGKVPLLVIICSARISGVNYEEKGKFVAEFLVLLVNIPSWWAQININCSRDCAVRTGIHL